MTRLEMYNDQQSRFDEAFCQGGTSCDALCQNCGRTYFVTSSGHGDYEEGTLEKLLKLSETNPDRYIEVSYFGSVRTFWMNGKQVVVGCDCDPTAKWSEFIEDNAVEITEYLRLFWESRLKKGQSIVSEAEQSLATNEQPQVEITVSQTEDVE